MGYIGNTPAEKYITLSKQTFTPDSSTVAFTLDNPVANENELAVFVNNVRQEPGSGKAYTATGTTLTMSEAPTSGHAMYAIYLGKTMATNTPADGSVTGDMLSIPLSRDNVVARFNRTSTSGWIIEFRKDNSTVGSIGVDAEDDLYLNGANSQLRFYVNGSERAFLSTSTFSAQTDNTHNLGQSAKRWNNLYLSGGVYVGGTGDANLLDDYEEGTWTPTLGNMIVSGTFSSSGRYVKVGRMVLAYGKFSATTSIAFDTSGLLSGLPFAGAVTDQGTVAYERRTFDGAAGGIGIGDFSASRFFFKDSFQTTGSNQEVTFTIMYEASA